MMNNNRRFITGSLSAVITILSILTVLSATLLSVRLIDYIQVDEREVRLKSNIDTQFDLFSVEYENVSGEITVSGMDEQKVVAPGTSVEYTIRLRNADSTAIDFDLVPEISYTSDYVVPIYVRMLDSNDNYIVGDAKTWIAIQDVEDFSVK
jgi:hypothetical protein